MIAEAIEKVLELAPPLRETIHDLEYTSKPLTPIVPPQPATLSIDTLQGFVELLEAGLNGFSPDATFVWVKNEAKIALTERAADSYGVRLHHLEAVPTKGITQFPFFNAWGPQEEFVIGLQAHFQPSPDLDYLLNLTSHVDATASVKTLDNSVTQEVTVRNGVAFKAETEVRARLSLKPYRTFRELDQPASDFIFRIKEQAKFALFEADGGAWKIAAMAAIASWLSNRLKTSMVAGFGDIPIIR